MERVYFALLARDLSGADDAAVDRLALEPLASLPVESFFDALTRFQRSVDVVHFNDHGLDTASAVRIRARLAERVRASSSWRWMVRERSSWVEMHLGPAIATLFLNDYGWGQPARAYLPPALVERLTPFLPTLETCAVEGATHFVAILTLSLLEVGVRPTHLSFLLATAAVRDLSRRGELLIGRLTGRAASTSCNAIRATAAQCICRSRRDRDCKHRRGLSLRPAIRRTRFSYVLLCRFRFLSSMIAFRR